VNTPFICYVARPLFLLQHLGTSILSIIVLATSLPAQADSAISLPGGGPGDNFTCARTPTGGVKCWGNNYSGQLGDGSNISRSTPVDVVGLSSHVQAVTMGRAHACALTNSGGVKCWGFNPYGQLGDGTFADHNTPVDVVGLGSGVIGISAGLYSSCAVTSAGAAKCWGNNYSGQLGTGNTANSLIPADVLGFQSGVTAIATGGAHTCLLSGHGTPYCWGYNRVGQLGDNTVQDRYVPVAVVGIGNAVSLAIGGYHSCARLVLGGVKCWGSNESGQLGDNSTVNRYAPVDVAGLASEVIDIAAGYGFTCARTVSSAMKCWGNNGFGNLGDGSVINRQVPVEVFGLGAGVAGIVVRPFHSCALTNHDYQCWGANPNGNLGNGTTTNSSIPVEVSGSGFAEIFPANVDVIYKYSTNWRTSPGFAAGWIVTGDTAGTGLLSLRSAPIGNFQAACTEFTAPMLSGALTFQRRVSSDISDGFRVYIDDVLAPQSMASGNLPWTGVKIAVTAGTHTARFCYQKGPYYSSYADAAWVDSVIYPGMPMNLP
jgi:alpha-tubulin suppressor-like RCC1 family protein